MIQSFADRDTEALFHDEDVRKWRAIERQARRKLLLLHAARMLSELTAPPGNRLHPLKGDRAGQHAIRVNDQYRICFRWTDAGPEDVERTDDH